ncbi:acyl-coenzyme A thioesterase 3-like [Condylostylus longicornis]|uniref:acyl-coenzyme A thioesterase 3-like n=1 Tax=Condylostylus longicornis TaxID=2530218 RepID=UPI00244DB290|nr:acyl-coenzyme A thioesterase 3-like [Condylostylus longicornis]
MAANTTSPKLIVDQTSSLADERIHICAQCLQPFQCYTLLLSIIDEKSTLFKSLAFYLADADGKIDLARDAAIESPSGSYRGVFSEGLFSTLKPLIPYERLVRRDVTHPLRFVLSLWNGSTASTISDQYLRQFTSVVTSQHLIDTSLDFVTSLNVGLSESLNVGLSESLKPLAVQSIDRHFMKDGVRRVVVKEGKLRGTVFIPAGNGPFPGVLDISGAAGGLVEYRSALLASRGILAMSLAYIRYDDLPKSMKHLEIEYLEEAAEWLFQHPKVNPVSGGVGLIGSSKGGEFGIAAACYSRRITALCTVNGNIMSIGSRTTRQLSDVKYRTEYGMVTPSGVQYPPAPLDVGKAVLYDDDAINVRDSVAFPVVPELRNMYSKFRKPFIREGRQIVSGDKDDFGTATQEEETNSGGFFKFGETDFETIKQSMYPIEQVHADWCLFIAGESDQNWHSPVYALEAVRRLEAVGKKHVRALIYPKTGHYIDPPCAPFEEASFHPLAQSVVVWGGESFSHQAAQEDAWMQTQLFFKKALTSPPDPLSSKL